MSRFPEGNDFSVEDVMRLNFLPILSVLCAASLGGSVWAVEPPAATSDDIVSVAEISSDDCPPKDSQDASSEQPPCDEPQKPDAKAKPKPPVFPTAKTLPALGPYKPLFFDNDFSLLDEEDHEYLLGEELKRMSFKLWEQPFELSTGGELRHRSMDERNRLRPGGPGKSTYDLWRWRHYVDLKADDRIRLYVEGIDASSFGEELPEQQIDVNRWDLLNAFVDLTVFDDGDGSRQVLRYGRQELLFGRQRLVSPLDWGNTRRTFQGLRYLVKDGDWKADLFVVNPTNSATGYRSLAEFDNRFDRPNHDVYFSGAYSSYTGIKNTVVDLYWLWLEGTNDPLRPDGHRHTIGSRIARLFPVEDEGVWDLDVEGAYQFGHDSGARVDAAFAAGVLGYTFEVTGSPRFSGSFYFGSGDKTVGDLRNNTFSVLFPLGHAYWALSDNLSGQNLYDWSLQVDAKPSSKTTVTCAYHWFEMVTGNDRAYNVAGAPVGLPGRGTDLGDAVDLYGSVSLNPNVDLQAGYSWFWYGTFIDRTTPRGDASQFYLQSSIRY